MSRLSRKKGVSPHKPRTVLSNTESTNFSRAFSTQPSTTEEMKTNAIQMKERIEMESLMENSSDVNCIEK